MLPEWWGWKCAPHPLPTYLDPHSTTLFRNTTSADVMIKNLKVKRFGFRVGSGSNGYCDPARGQDTQARRV